MTCDDEARCGKNIKENGKCKNISSSALHRTSSDARGEVITRQTLFLYKEGGEAPYDVERLMNAILFSDKVELKHKTITLSTSCVYIKLPNQLTRGYRG